MKKNILSLVAFMAFSVSAFANTVEVKEEVVVEEEEVVGGIPCVDAANAAQNAFIGAMNKFGVEPTSLQIYNVFQTALDICERKCAV